MTELEIKGKKYAIDGDIQLEAHSPFFDNAEKVLSDGRAINPQGSNSFGVAKNDDGLFADEFKRIDLMQSKHYQHKLSNVKLLADGIKVDEGNLYVNRIKKNINNRSGQFQMTLLSGERDDFMEAIDGKTLKDIQVGGLINIPGGDISAWGAYVQFDTDPESDALAGSEQMISIVNQGTGSSPGTNYPLANPYADLGYGEHAATAAYATSIVNDGHPAICFPSVAFVDGQEDENGQIPYIVANRWSTDNKFITYTTELVGSAYYGYYTKYTDQNNPIIPMFYYKAVLEAVFSNFGYVLKPSALTDDEQFNRLIIVNNHSIKKTRMVYLNNIFGLSFSDYVLYYEDDTVIDSKNHVPEMSLVDFLADFMLKFNCYFDVVGKNVFIRQNELSGSADREIKKYNPNIDIEILNEVGMKLAYNLENNNSYENEVKLTMPLTNIKAESVQPNTYFVDKKYNKIYRVGVSTSEAVGNNLIGYTSGDFKEYTMEMSPINHKLFNSMRILDGASLSVEVNFPFSFSEITGNEIAESSYTVQTIAYNNDGTFWYNVSYSELDYFNDFQFQAINNVTQVAFYYGLQKIGALDFIGSTNDFPYMSHFNYKPNVTEVKLGDWHLGIIGAEGLVDTFWKDFVHVMNARRKFIIEAFEPITNAIKHVWQRSVIVRGTRLYVAKFQRSLKNKDKTVYECYEIRN